MRTRRRRERATAGIVPEKEAELCELFAAAARHDGWTVYPEIDGWDLVLVWTGEKPTPAERLRRRISGIAGLRPEDVEPDDLRPGDQLGVQAKLRANVEVLAQATRRAGVRSWKGPDFRAVLVAEASLDFVEVAGRLGVDVFTLRNCRRWVDPRDAKIAKRWAGRVPFERDREVIGSPARRWQTSGRLWLPPVVPGGVGGKPSPSSLTPWRVKALRICARLRARGAVTTADFRELGISHQRWIDRWIVRDGSEGKLARYVIAEGAALPDVGYERERDEIAALDNPSESHRV